MVQRVSILKNELLATGNSKERFESVLDQKGQWLFRSYRDGAGIVELMDQLFSLPYMGSSSSVFLIKKLNIAICHISNILVCKNLRSLR